MKLPIKPMTLHKKIFFRRRRLVIGLVLLMLLTAGAALTAAKYVHSSNLIEDTYCPDTYDKPQINETVTSDDNGFYAKTFLSVMPADTTDYPVYVRVALLPVWQNEQGVVYGRQPVEGTDYTLAYDHIYWLRYRDGYFYCTMPVTAGCATPPLLSEDEVVRQIKAAPVKGYTLHVVTAAETIQAIGTVDDGLKEAVVDAWGHQPVAE